MDSLTSVREAKFHHDGRSSYNHNSNHSVVSTNLNSKMITIMYYSQMTDAQTHYPSKTK